MKTLIQEIKEKYDFVALEPTKLVGYSSTIVLEKYIFEKGIDNFTYRRLNKLLTNSVIYVNGNRMTNKLINQSDERIGDTNRFNQEFEIAVNYNEQKEYEYQLFEPLELISFIPSGNYTAQIPVIETSFMNINSNDKILINGTDTLKYTV